MTDFLSNLLPKTPLPLPGTPFSVLPPGAVGAPHVTPPPPPRSPAPPTEQVDIPLTDFVTPMPEPTPPGAGHTTPQEELSTPGTRTLTPEALRQQLLDAGFDEEGADAVTAIGGTLKLSEERIRELLNVTEGPAFAGIADDAEHDNRLAAVYDAIYRVLGDPRIRDEYTRGMTAINAHTDPGATTALGDYSPTDQAANLYDVEARLNRPGGEGGLGATAKHEIGHHIANQMLASTYVPKGYAAAIQLDYERRKDEGRDNPISPWASDYAASGQARGASLAEDFADAMKMRLSDLGSQREAFRKNFPARAAFIDALLYAMVNPDKEGARLGIERKGESFGQRPGLMGAYDEVLGKTVAARNLLEQEIALWRGRGNTAAVSELEARRGDQQLYTDFFDKRVTNPAILQALRTFQQGGYRYDQLTEE